MSNGADIGGHDKRYINGSKHYVENAKEFLQKVVDEQPDKKDILASIKETLIILNAGRSLCTCSSCTAIYVYA